MKKVLSGVMALCMSAWMMSCGCSNKAANGSGFVFSGKWNIVSVNQNQLGTMENTPFLDFDSSAKSVNGNAGCNIINGSYTQGKGNSASLKFGDMLSTMMACPDGDTERKILDALSKVSKYQINEDGTASLLNASGKEVLKLKK